MRGLGNMVARLTAARRAAEEAGAGHQDRLGDLTGFGSNPGNLRARTYVSESLRAGAPLVVVLHGCTQNASIYDRGSGWSGLAEREGFALLFPEQQRANNPNLCFNWYVPKEARRDRGEAMSISQMIGHMIVRHQLDPSRVFVTGLSAGGAMTSVMLATYPELFAGGAIIAGLPFATANTLPDALARMRGPGGPSRRELAARAGKAATHRGSFPTLSVWHGTQDTIVDPVNADAIVDQWRDLHGVGSTPGVVDMVDGHRRETWRDNGGRPVIEKYDVRGMGHGTPLGTRGSEGCGKAGPHMLEAGICSTSRIAAFWGLTDVRSDDRKVNDRPDRSSDRMAGPPDRPVAKAQEMGAGAVIENALRAAGLMR